MRHSAGSLTFLIKGHPIQMRSFVPRGQVVRGLLAWHQLAYIGQLELFVRAGNLYWKESRSTVDLLVRTSLDQLLFFIANIIFSFTKRADLMRRRTILKLLLGVPWSRSHKTFFGINLPILFCKLDISIAVQQRLLTFMNLPTLQKKCL